jgi:mannose-6-phosphate isomerase-like protein (cupin superfamily)
MGMDMKANGVKITSLYGPTPRAMKRDKGIAHDLVGLPDGAQSVDVHVNVLRPDIPPAPYHFHAETENVYILLEGEADAIIDGEHFRLSPMDVVFIPPGVPHALGSTAGGPVKLIEIYAPAGQDFHLVDGEDQPTEG